VREAGVTILVFVLVGPPAGLFAMMLPALFASGAGFPGRDALQGFVSTTVATFGIPAIFAYLIGGPIAAICAVVFETGFAPLARTHPGALAAPGARLLPGLLGLGMGLIAAVVTVAGLLLLGKPPIDRDAFILACLAAGAVSGAVRGGSVRR
jgi:hypothetical protein